MVNADYNGITKYSARIALSTRGSYRFRAVTQASDEWNAATSSYSAVVKVKRIATLGRPRTASAVSRGARFTAWGTIKPRVAAGSKTVKLVLYRYSSGKWRYVKMYTATNANYYSYSKYVLRLRLYGGGYYRFKAVWPESSAWARATSNYSYTMRVR